MYQGLLRPPPPSSSPHSQPEPQASETNPFPAGKTGSTQSQNHPPPPHVVRQGFGKQSSNLLFARLNRDMKPLIFAHLHCTVLVSGMYSL